MMILTMEAPETATRRNGHGAVTNGKACSPTNCVEPFKNSIRGTAGSSSSLTSSCSNSSSSTMSSDMLKVKKRVSFSLQQTAYFSPEQRLSKEERKIECWYSEAELNVSRDEARIAIQAMHHQLQLDVAAATEATHENSHERVAPVAPVAPSWFLSCPHDETKIVCLRGIEKYADAAAKYAGQKRLINSVLQQQSINNDDVHVSLVSQTLSKPFKEVARYYALKSAEELDFSRKVEQEQEEIDRQQREEVATVLLLIMGQENSQKQQETNQPLPKPSPQPSSSKKQTCSVAVPLEPMSGKRSSLSTLCQSRNVKPCIRGL